MSVACRSSPGHKHWLISSAMCVVLRPVACSICSRQLNPLASRMVSGAAARTLGSRTRSAAVIDTSYFSDSKPNEPAMSQQPDGRNSHATPRRSRMRFSDCGLMTA